MRWYLRARVGTTPWRLVLGLGVSVGLLAAAFTLPTDWYDALPRLKAAGPLPMRGTTLLQVMLVVQALVIAGVSVLGAPWHPRWGLARIDFPVATVAGQMSRGQAMWWLSGITVVALALRTYGIGADLWIDELTTLNQYARQSVPHIIGSFRTPNNHLLTSLLMKGSIALFGEHEWSIRLATVACGVATIPAIYRVTRLVASREASLAAAALLAVSYHHVFFSQNARGYVAYVLFALVATRALCDALRDDRRHQWLLYGAATVLGFLSLLHTVFVVAAQAVVVAWLLVQRRRSGAVVRPTLIRLAVVWSITGFICLEVLAIALPEAFVIITRAYTRPATGFAPSSPALSIEILARLADGFAAGALWSALPFLLLSLAGFTRLWRHHAAVTAMLLLPGVLTASLLVVRGFTFSPRYFLLWLPLAVIAAAVAIEMAVDRLRGLSVRSHRRAYVATTLAVGLISALALPRYYAVPKQPYRETLRFLERIRNPDDLVLVVHPAQLGVRFYGDHLRVPIARDYAFVRTVPTLDSVLLRAGARRTWMITTLERGATLERPDLWARVRAGWRRDTTFDATIGDGQLSVWSEKGSR